MGHLLKVQERQKHLYNRGTRLREFAPERSACVILPSSSSKLLAKWQGPFVVTRRKGNVDYEVVRSDGGVATQIYHLNLLKAWREAEPVSLVTTVTERNELWSEVPKFANSTSRLCGAHLTP